MTVNPGQSRSLGITAALLAVFATVLGVVSAGSNEHAWDISLAQWIQRWDGNFGETLYRIGDMLGTTALAAAITVIGLIIAIAKKQLHISIFLVGVLIFRLLGTQLKPIFDSPRPTEEHLRMLEPFDGTGYPSGHSMTAAMVAAMLTLIAWRYASNPRIKWAATAIAAITLVLVGWSRVWSGAHWPTDVLGGWSYGIALVFVTWIASDAIVAQGWLRRDTAPRNATD